MEPEGSLPHSQEPALQRNERDIFKRYHEYTVVFLSCVCRCQQCKTLKECCHENEAVIYFLCCWASKSLSKIQDVRRSSCEVHDIFVRLERKFNFRDRLLTEVPNTKFQGNPSSDSVVNADRRTDVTKLTDAFRDFANAPTKRKKMNNGIRSRNPCCRGKATTSSLCIVELCVSDTPHSC